MPNAHTVLLIDDEASIRTILGRELGRAGFDVTTAASVDEARPMVQSAPPDAVVLDIRMPGTDGATFLRELKEGDPALPVIILTGHANVESAVACMKDGASDLLTKPCSVKQLAFAIERAIETGRLRDANRTLSHYVRAAPEPGMVVGSSAAMRAVLKLAERVAPTEEPILIVGESGVGKELIAHHVRRCSRRADGPFIAVNCAAIAETLIESELFGHERGSFSGAAERRIGFFELADGGTIFLDEIGEMPLPMQAKLLRVLQSGELWRVGGSKPVAVDVRVIAASNRHLADEVREGRFREDLLYRINTIVAEVPPLRERLDDLEELASAFLAEFGDGRHRTLGAGVLAALRRHSWPGNVRELRNVLRRAAILCDDDVIETIDLPPALARAATDADVPALDDGDPVALAEVERRHILRVLRQCDGNRARAARELGISVRTIFNRLEAWGIGGDE